MFLLVCFVLCFWFQRRRAHMVSGESWSRQAGGTAAGRLASHPSVGSVASGPFQGWGPLPSPPEAPPRGPVVVCAEWGALVCLVLSEDFLRCCPTAACQIPPLCWGLHGCGRRGVSRDVEGGRVGCWGPSPGPESPGRWAASGSGCFSAPRASPPHPSPASARPLS